MYAVIEKNRLHISVAQYYSMDWYGKEWLGSRKDTFQFEYGSLEVDVHKNRKKYLTGFVVDPRAFIVDYLQTRYKKTFWRPRRVVSFSMDSSEHTELFSVDFLKTTGFVVDGMEKDLIFPMFAGRKGRIKIQGFEVLEPISVIRYLAKKFGFRGTTLIRMGNDVYDFRSGRKWKIERKKSPRRRMKPKQPR